MTEPAIERLRVGDDAMARDLALLRRPGRAPGLFWLGGYRSEMTGSKASAVDALGEVEGLAVTRFDYSGHGRSDGRLRDGTISRWLEESLAVFATTVGDQVVIGSSMGGWLALLMNRALRRRGEQRVKALILIAPAVDMTETLMLGRLGKAERKAFERDGVIERRSAYSDDPDILTRDLVEDGRGHLLLARGIETGCPVTILQGGADRDVPNAHALALVSRLLSDPVTFTLVPDGDHRLSRPQDLKLLEAAIRRAVGASPA